MKTLSKTGTLPLAKINKQKLSESSEKAISNETS